MFLKCRIVYLWSPQRLFFCLLLKIPLLKRNVPFPIILISILCWSLLFLLQTLSSTFLDLFALCSLYLPTVHHCTPEPLYHVYLFLRVTLDLPQICEYAQNYLTSTIYNSLCHLFQFSFFNIENTMMFYY